MKKIIDTCKRAGNIVPRILKGVFKDQRGTSVVLFAAAVVPAFSSIGTGIDITRVMMARSKLTAAVDAAALAGGRVYYSASRDADIESYFKANLAGDLLGSTIDGPYSEDNETLGTLRVWASATVPTGFMRLVGVEDITVSTESVVSRKNAILDVVLAIDLSGSMLSSVPGEIQKRVDAAKAASKDLVEIIYGTPVSNQVRVGIVPWGGKVNVTDFGSRHGVDQFGNAVSDPVGNGTANDRYRSASLGRTYDNPFVRANYTYSYRIGGDNQPGLNSALDPYVSGTTLARERFVLPGGYEDRISRVYYAHNSGVPLLAPPPINWKGCVYARYAFSGTPASWNKNAGSNDVAADKTSAADEVDSIVTDWGPRNKAWVGWMPMGEEGEPQSGSNKCDLARLHDLSHDCTPCLDSGIHRLSKDKAQALRVIDALEAQSSVYTNIPQGLIWAYRVLSEPDPFSESGEDNTASMGFDKERAIILLTDGANTVRAGDAYNTGINSSSKRDQRLKDIADMIQDDDVYIYTVQFANGSASLGALMKYVATKPDAPFYHYAPNTEDLRESFKSVANNLANLRISK